MNPIDRDKIELELSKRHFKFFVKRYWPIVDSEEFIPGWYVDCLCDHLEAVHKGQIKKLVINIPPGFGKSIITTVMFPAWVWALEPSKSFLCATRDSSNLKRDSNRFYNLINSSKYREDFGSMYKFGGDAKKVRGDKYSEDNRNIHNDKMGYRRALTSGSSVTGARGKITILDDPNDRKDAFSKVERDRINEFVFKTLSTRNFAKLGGATIIVMQRLHLEDVAGEAIKRDYQVLNIPMECKGDSSIPLEHWKDEREVGEFLNDSLFDQESKQSIIKDLGSREYATQYQQEPSMNEGSIIKREWIKYYDRKILNKAYNYYMSWDMTFKGSKTSDFVVGQVWAKHGADRYLVDQVRGKWSFTQTIDEFIKFTEKHPEVSRKLVEAKANGQAIIDTLNKHITGIIPVNPRDSKEARVNAVAPQFESGNVYLPEGAHFIDDYVEELVGFPFVKNDDQVDTTTQALLDAKEAAKFAFVSSKSGLPRRF